LNRQSICISSQPEPLSSTLTTKVASVAVALTLISTG